MVRYFDDGREIVRTWRLPDVPGQPSRVRVKFRRRDRTIEYEELPLSVFLARRRAEFSAN